MKSKNYLLFLFLLISSYSFANNSLRIIDPQGSWWYNYSPTIKNAELAVKPIGGFIENDLTLEIGLEAPFSQNDLKLEIILDFSLPENSMVTDSWLWINGVPKQSEIMDRWTASNIYEEIVNRRKDPSLLIKNGDNQYTINVYPLNPNETRKFRITYLTPIEYAGNMIYCQYPSGILKTSTTSLSKLTILAIPADKFKTPSILYGSASFSSYNDSEYGNCYKAQIPNAEFGKAQIAFTNTNTNPLKVYQYKEGGYYQLSFTPSEVFNIESSSEKICYLIDYDENYLVTSKNDLLSILKNNLTGNYTQKDSFNIIFSNLSLNPVFENWKPITAQNLNEAFNNPTLTNYSNLVPLLAKGITYINNSGGKGKIVLLSNNAIFQGVDNSNNILKDINNLNTNNIPVDVINYMDNYYNYYWIGSTYYYGNSYLYTNIARTNSGQYLTFYDQTGNNSFSELLRNSLISVSNQAINNVDVYTNLENGYCYGRMNYTSSGFQNYSMNTP
ncbi:MAG TPA: VIT domain-containing protein, partial [Prolixibacteraceae bacterium]|nr:VIT domain-containing protein [Prolixibacteraceae bacterium]